VRRFFQVHFPGNGPFAAEAVGADRLRSRDDDVVTGHAQHVADVVDADGGPSEFARPAVQRD
jgi:hypothetical protein